MHTDVDIEPPMRVVTQIISDSGFYNAWENAMSSTITQLLTSCLFLELPHIGAGQSPLIRKNRPSPVVMSCVWQGGQC